jgi:hypothetical protein
MLLPLQSAYDKPLFSGIIYLSYAITNADKIDVDPVKNQHKNMLFCSKSK